MDLIDKVDLYQTEREKKDDMKKALEEQNKRVDELRKSVTREMKLTECVSIGRNGYTYSLQTKVHYSKKAGADETLFQVLRSFGLGDIIKETVNPRTLESTMKNFMEEEDELPQEFEEVISVYEVDDILRRKV